MAINFENLSGLISLRETQPELNIEINDSLGHNHIDEEIKVNTR